MISSGRLRKIASNLAWTPQGIVRSPLAVVDADGRLLSIEVCAEPDRVAYTEFYAGLLVFDFPTDWRACFEALINQAQTPLPELLESLPAVDKGIVVVISGLDYQTLRLTAHSRIEPIG